MTLAQLWHWQGLLITGLLAGGHCLLMCGGISHLIGYSARETGIQGGGVARIHWGRVMAYNIGRILGYGTLGAGLGLLGRWANGALGDGAEKIAVWAPTLFQILAGLTLILMGVYLAGFGRYMVWVEKMGLPLWRFIEPMARQFLPPKKMHHALFAGYLWGFLPCGIVYLALLQAFATANPVFGFLAMVIFGLGTLPNLLLIGWGFAFLSRWRSQVWFRYGSGLLLIAWGVVGIRQIPQIPLLMHTLFTELL